jgi:hypothetical protein
VSLRRSGLCSLVRKSSLPCVESPTQNLLGTKQQGRAWQHNLALIFAAGVPISVNVTPPQQCKGPLKDVPANVVVQYKAQ